MSVLVADTSGLVSLGVGSARGREEATVPPERDLLALCLAEYNVYAPEIVVDELRSVASHDDVHGRGAETVLDRSDELTVRKASLDADFPLDDGENAAVALANEVDAALFLCDEFNRLGLIHASLADTRLVTTPTLLSVFVRRTCFTDERALDALGRIGAARSWDGNSYVERARSLLES